MPLLEDDSMPINDVAYRVSGTREDGEIEVKRHVVNICPSNIGRVLRIKRAQLGNEGFCRMFSDV